jgi:hypothetical protein
MTEYPESQRRGPNWPLIAIAAGAAVTLAIVIAIFVSTATAPKHPGLPTTTALSTVDGSATTEQEVSVQLTDTCAYTVIGGVKSFAIWPKGYTRDSNGDVLAPNGTTYASNGSFTASTIATTVDGAVKLDGADANGYIGTLLSQCSAGNDHVTILTKIDG